jgi:hypothetical protein
MAKKWYKIIEEDSGTYKTLMHGINKNRKLELNKWLKAEIKEVSDGTGKRKYKSGFHVLKSYRECVQYLKLFKKDLHKKRIVECEARNLWPKSHSKHEVYLAEYIKIKDVC